ncbi:MAG: collagen binding domain-containing protein, partial [Pyrinomonadaceae bacterium]
MVKDFELAGVHFARLCRFSVFLALVVGWPLAAKASVPVLLSRANSTRAVALEALNLQREPFALTSSSLLGSQDQRTRILLFAVNLSGADASMVTADAEDGSHRHYNFKVEYVGPLKGGEALGISQLTVRLSDDLTVVGDVLMQINYGGVVSNRVRVAIGYVGDGLPDDFIKISGRVGTNANGLAGALVMLSGTINEPTVTDASGNYAFTNVVPGGSYSVTASRINYTLSPQNQNLPFLVSDQIVNFSATPTNYVISGQITNNNNPLSGVTINLSGSQSATTTTEANGNYSFTAPAEGNYMVTPTSPLYSFGPSSGFFSNLSSNQALNFVVVSRPSYSISGFAKNADGSDLAGTTLTLSGTQTATVITDAKGFYAFANLTAGGNYTVAASKVNYTLSPSSQSFSNLDKNQTVNFTATLLTLNIGGRVTNANGAGVPFVSMNLSGSQSATTLTDTNGNYVFAVLAGGNYAVTPSSQLNSFSPAIATFDNVSTAHTANFAALDFNGFFVLEFNGSGQTVDYGDFFELQPGQTKLGKFFWEFWAMPGTDSLARYLLSDGYG